MEYFIEILYSNQKIDKKVRYILEEICTRFNKYSYGESEYSVEIWNHNAMATGLFWDELRKLAKQALENMKTT